MQSFSSPFVKLEKTSLNTPYVDVILKSSLGKIREIFANSLYQQNSNYGAIHKWRHPPMREGGVFQKVKLVHKLI